MMRFSGILSALLAVVLISSCINDDLVKESYILAGDRIPDFTVEMNDGRVVTSGQLSSGVSLIMFFHTSCPDCQVTLPEVQRIYDEFLPKNVQFALISREEDNTSVSLYWKANNINMPYSAQPTRSIYNLFASSRIPRVYICVDGVVKAFFTDNPNPKYEDMSSVLNELI